MGNARRHNTYEVFDIEWPAPLDVSRSLDVFRRWGDDLIERWDGRVLVRTARVEGESIPYVCTVTGTVDAPAVRVMVPSRRHVPCIEPVVRQMFVTAPQPLAELAAADPVIATLEATYRGVRAVIQSDLLTALIRSISAQQVNLTWATTTRRRLAEAFGRQHELAGYRVISLDAPDLAARHPAELRALQFTTRKSEYIVALATAVAHGSLDLEALREAPDQQVVERLTALRGLGRWTSEWFLARALGRPRVAAGDLGVRKAVGLVYLDGRLPLESEVRALTAHWGAAAGVAQQLVLQALSDSASKAAKEQ